MTQRIHDYIDGRLPLSALTDEERRELSQLQTAISGSLDHVRDAPTPDVASLVMARVRASEARNTTSIRALQRERAASWLTRVRKWFWTPRTVQLRPAWGFASVALMALAVSVASSEMPRLTSSGGAMAGGAMEEARVTEHSAQDTPDPVLYVRFELDASGASSVSLAGSFTDWQPSLELSELAPGHWTALVPLKPGVHDYAFVVDGDRWVADPNGISIRDAFGGVNSRIALLSPEA
jgi:hypothetical protein